MATSRASETPKAGRSPCLSTAELPQEPDASADSGATTPKGDPSEGGTSTVSRYSKLSLGFPPLPGFFRSRNSPSIVQRSATDTGEEGRESGALVDVPPDSSEVAEIGRIGKVEDDDDRRTIKGVIVDSAEQSATAELKPGTDGHVPNGAVSAGEKVADAQSLNGVSSVVAVDRFE